VVRLFVFLLSLVALPNCSGGIRSYITAQRNVQGDRSLARNNFKEAALAYRLALDINPEDQHARSGLASVQTQLAAVDYRASKFDDALDALAVAAKYDPQSVRIAQLKAAIDASQLKQAIVISNYPTYRETGLQLRHSFASLRKIDNTIVSSLQKFDYTYDANQLTDAIRQSSILNQEVAHLTARVAAYRQLVESGASQKSGRSTMPSESLLPLP
jgi:tetratricopeptide (TPR) repeat protein